MSTVVYIDGQNFLYKVAEILLAANLISNTDLLPALQIIKEKHVKLSYIAFKNQATISLAKIADQVFYLENQQVINAYLKSLNRQNATLLFSCQHAYFI